MLAFMKTRVLLTVDTELTWRHHVAGKGWKENYRRSVEPAGVGLSYQLAKLREYRLKGVFFVDPMPTVLFGLEPVKRMVGTVMDAGQDVQLHLHPMWEQANEDGTASDDAVFELIDHCYEEQRRMLVRACDLLVEAGAPDPIAYRAGSYAANCDTLRALADLGIRYDSSHNGCEAPWPSALALAPKHIAPVMEKGIVEVPVSQMIQPGGGLRHMQICAVTLADLREGLDFAIANTHPTYTIIGHSFELATRDGRKVNKIAKRRFDGLCRLLADRRDEAPTAHFADLEGISLTENSKPASASRARVMHRMAEQLWSIVVEERRA